jgi:SAM-dependent methyltransferase
MRKVEFDPARFKEQERTNYNFTANSYEDGAAGARPARDRIVKLAELKEGLRVLDVATGPGLLARQIAPLVGTSGYIIGVDIAEETLKQARQKATEGNLPQIRFEVADAEALPFDDTSFDRVLCSQGLMHFPQAETAILEFKRVLKPGGKLVASVLGDEGQFPFSRVAWSVVTYNFPVPKVETPSVFRFGKPGALAELVSGAGFNEIHIEPVRLEINFPSPDSYWKTFLSVAGGLALALEKMPREVQVKLEQDVEKELQPYKTETGYVLDSIMLVVSATA